MKISFTKEEIDYLRYILKIGFAIAEDLPKSTWKKEYRILSQLRKKTGLTA